MAMPTPNDVRTYLEGYGVTTQILGDTWIENVINTEVIPYVESLTGQSISEIKTVTEYHNGNGRRELLLNRRPIAELVDVKWLTTPNVPYATFGDVELNGSKGSIRFKYVGLIFPKGVSNIEVTYKFGYTDPTNTIKTAIILYAAYKVLNHLGSQTGGGSLSVQAHSRNYGPGGKYADVIKPILKSFNILIKPYQTAVVGD